MIHIPDPIVTEEIINFHNVIQGINQRGGRDEHVAEVCQLVWQMHDDGKIKAQHSRCDVIELLDTNTFRTVMVEDVVICQCLYLDSGVVVYGVMYYTTNGLSIRELRQIGHADILIAPLYQLITEYAFTIRCDYLSVFYSPYENGLKKILCEEYGTIVYEDEYGNRLYTIPCKY